MTATVTIREYQATDIDDVIAIAQDLQRHERQFHDRMKPPTEIGAGYVAYMQSNVAKRQGKFLVAEHQGEVVGFATLLTHCDSAEDEEEVFFTYAVIADLSVREGARNIGIGRSLVTACENIARSDGVKWLRLYALTDNLDALRFYDRAGFKPRLVQMEKAL